MPNDKPIVTCKYSRLTFNRDLIEPLDVNDSFRVETPVGVFQMTKGDFYEVFKSVTESKSYVDNGLFNYRTVPEKAFKYLLGNERLGDSKIQYALPPFLQGVCTPATYKRWLHRKAMAHFKRDSKRGINNISCSKYKQAIHLAVLNGGQYDAYSGEPLDWSLISKYDNEGSRMGKREYKKGFAYLPTVDHFDNNCDNPTFKICSWQLNDCKNDLNLDEFLEVCRKVLKHHQDNTE